MTGARPRYAMTMPRNPHGMSDTTPNLIPSIFWPDCFSDRPIMYMTGSAGRSNCSDKPRSRGYWGTPPESERSCAQCLCSPPDTMASVTVTVQALDCVDDLIVTVFCKLLAIVQYICLKCGGSE